jgi:NAD(P)-dependent dehydrogenase (short-subunit alcohol dehydrogenase family)
MDKVVLVTGASSGIGAETARRFAAAGWTVWGLSRSGGAPDGVAPLVCDVTEPAAVAEAVRTLLAASGRLDLLINCAGFGISGAAELTDEADSLRQMQVNLHGAAAVCRACLPALRQSRGFPSPTSTNVPPAWSGSAPTGITSSARTRITRRISCRA